MLFHTYNSGEKELDFAKQKCCFKYTIVIYQNQTLRNKNALQIYSQWPIRTRLCETKMLLQIYNLFEIRTRLSETKCCFKCTVNGELKLDSAKQKFCFKCTVGVKLGLDSEKQKRCFKCRVVVIKKRAEPLAFKSQKNVTEGYKVTRLESIFVWKFILFNKSFSSTFSNFLLEHITKNYISKSGH